MVCTGRSSRIFVFLWPITSPLLPHLTCPRALPTSAYLLGKKDSNAKANGKFDNTLWGGTPSLFDPRGGFLRMCRRGACPDLRSDRRGRLISLLQQGSAPATNFVLGVSGKAELQVTLLGKLQPLSPGAHLFLTPNLP